MIEQGSLEWKLQRVGRVTASRVSDVIAKTRSGWGASRANYMAELLVERLTGQPVEQYTSFAMMRGTEIEPQARLDYQMMFDCEVEQVGFIPHPRIDMCGASPDGFIGDDGLIEIKCPNTATHISTLLGTSVSGDYIAQMQWQMSCCDRQWCDWVSYDPRLPPSMQLFVKRVTRDQSMIDSLECEVVEFLAELDQKLADLRARYETDKAA